MWIIAAPGFISVVEFNPKMDVETAHRHDVPLDGKGDWMLVRGRTREHIEYVAGPLNRIVDSDTSADYKYRTIITRDELKSYMNDEIDNIRYGSHFKEESMAHPVNKGNKLWREALYKIWDTLELIQDTPSYLTKVWSRKYMPWPQTGPHSAKDSAAVFAGTLGTADGWSLDGRYENVVDPDLDEDDLWLDSILDRYGDLTVDELASLTDAELEELADNDSYWAANAQIVADNESISIEQLMQEPPEQTAPVSEAPRKIRRRNRRNRNKVKEGK